jgi:Domain of unknown function (DUF4189)
VSLSLARLIAAVASLILIAALAAPAQAAGALSVGKCGAFGHAFDFKNARAAIDAAQKQCRGDCKTISMRRACAALSVDMANPCGAHGYAVAPRISSAQNTAMRNCYKFGGKECVIRTWACDARG